MTAWLLLALAYLWGAIPASYVAGRLTKGIDLRQHGSGNLGATNAFRVLGPKVAAPVMLFDVFKGFGPAFLFPRMLGEYDLRWALAFGAAAIVGHVFSVFVSFKGGKGVATGAGVFLALAPLAVGLGFAVWLLVLAVARMVSLGSILAAATVGVTLLVTEHPLPVRAVGLAIVAFIIWAHRANIGRILRGEEPRFGRKKTPAGAP